MTTTKKNGQSKEQEAVEQILMKTSHTVHSAALYLCLWATCFLLLASCAGTQKNAPQDTSSASSTLTDEQKAQERNHILKKAEDTLAQLYKSKPEAKKAIESAYGYAVFSNTGYNIILYVGGKGAGVAFKNSDKKPVFMTMLNAGTGPGVGYEDYRQVLVFSSETLFDQFITVGLNTSASANATVKIGKTDVDESGAISLVPGVGLYQITEKGIDIQANWGGMKYFKDSHLNK
jgi:lipid-binding SYLF domain-containing protein